MAAPAGDKAVFFQFLTEAAITPKLFILLTPKLAWIILIIMSADGACYLLKFLCSLSDNWGSLNSKRGALFAPQKDPLFCKSAKSSMPRH